MAAKNTRKGSSKNDKPFKVILPEGFKAINPQGTSWKPDNVGDSLQGILTKRRLINVKRKHGKKEEEEETTIYTIENDDGAFDVWRSGGLRALDEVPDGTEVYIVFTGFVDTGQPQPMRAYTVATVPRSVEDIGRAMQRSGKKSKKG